jgi:hypothetical protein
MTPVRKALPSFDPFAVAGGIAAAAIGSTKTVPGPTTMAAPIAHPQDRTTVIAHFQTGRAR